MILNERGYHIRKARVPWCVDAIAKAEASGPPANADPQTHQAYLDYLRAMLKSLEDELRAYERTHGANDHDSWNLTPQIECRAVDHVKTAPCSNCGRDVEIPREEPWIIAGDQEHTPMLVSFRCPHCEHHIRA